MRDPAGGGYLVHRINKERTSKKVSLLSVADSTIMTYCMDLERGKMCNGKVVEVECANDSEHQYGKQ